MGEKEPTHWTLDKRIPLALIVTLAIQSAGVAYMFGVQSARLNQVEKIVEARGNDGTRITTLEVKLDGINQTLERIETLLERNGAR